MFTTSVDESFTMQIINCSEREVSGIEVLFMPSGMERERERESAGAA